MSDATSVKSFAPQLIAADDEFYSLTVIESLSQPKAAMISISRLCVERLGPALLWVEFCPAAGGFR